MSLTFKINSAIKKMFSTLKDFQVTATYIVKGTDVFDPETGKVSFTETNTPITGISLNYQEFIGSDKAGEKTDLAFVYLASKSTVVPDTQDIITISGKSYTIMTCEQDPARATWSLQLRAV